MTAMQAQGINCRANHGQPVDRYCDVLGQSLEQSHHSWIFVYPEIVEELFNLRVIKFGLIIRFEYR